MHWVLIRNGSMLMLGCTASLTNYTLIPFVYSCTAVEAIRGGGLKRRPPLRGSWIWLASGRVVKLKTIKMNLDNFTTIPLILNVQYHRRSLKPKNWSIVVLYNSVSTLSALRIYMDCFEVHSSLPTCSSSHFTVLPSTSPSNSISIAIVSMLPWL